MQSLPAPAAARRLLGCICLALLPATAGAQTAPTAGSAPVAVTVAPAATVHFHPERDAPATVVARNESRIGAEIAARIAAIPFDVGQTVARGTVVVQLDPVDARLAVQQAQATLNAAQARLALAESQLERARDLHRQQFISAEALAQRETETAVVRTEVATADSLLAGAQRTLDKTVVRAPFAGVVMARPGQVGEIAQPGAALLVLKETAAPEVSSPVPTAHVADFTAGAAFEFSAQSQRYRLRLLRLSPAVQAATRTREARLAFSEAAPPAGTEGRLLWRAAQPHLPAELIVQRQVDGRTAFGVFVLDGERARFVPLADAQAGRPAASPLAATAQVVVAGQGALQDGAAVTATPR
jgi:RND family efflux transporter MFP subunit